jgi:hypothetical protein
MSTHSTQHARGLRGGILGAVLLTLLAVGSTQPAFAFDTGHHSDLTREALQPEGFGDAPIKVVQLQNWLVDYFSSSPTSRVEDETNMLHFDNLFTPEQARNCFGRFRVNTKTLVQQAAKDQDPVKLLTVMGMTLHAVQDFYTHSNWVELHPRAAGAPYRTETWFGGPLPAGMNVFTAHASHYKGPTPPAYVQPHGGYTSGMNHDEYGRPRWDEAYVFAYVACREWVSAIRGWVNEARPGYWNTLKAYAPNAINTLALERDHWAAYRISEWAKTGDEDGHWKGRGSGSRSDFLGFSANWITSSDSIFTNQFKGSNSTLQQMSKGLYTAGPPATTPPDVPPLTSFAYRAVIVRTLSVKEKGDESLTELKVDPGGDADFYAKITVAGQTFVEAMQLDKSSFTPAWTTIKFIPATTASVAIKYELWDEDSGPAGDDDHADINPATGARDLNFTLSVTGRALSGDITGVHDSAASAVTSEGKKGDSDRAVVRFFTTVVDLVRK